MAASSIMSATHAVRVMIVDDHRTMLWGLEKLVESQGARMEVIATACSSAEALALIGTLVPDVILLDLDLNGECSLDILPALLANGKSKVLILTATRDKALLDTAVTLGVRGVVHKEASAGQLLKAIEKVHEGELWIDREILSRLIGGIMNPSAARKPDPEAARKAALTEREKKIIATVVASSGAANRLLANRLFISEHTLRNHLTSIYQKLGVGNRLELYVYAVKHHIAQDSL